MSHNSRYVPFIQSVKIRAAIGFILLILLAISSVTIFDNGHLEIVILVSVFAWMMSVFFTDKYTHKYPQRYFTYLAASHLKAAIIMMFFLWITINFVVFVTVPHDVLMVGYIFFIFLDFAVSIPCRRDEQYFIEEISLETKGIIDDKQNDLEMLSSINTQAIVSKIRLELDKAIIKFIEKNLPVHNEGIEDVLIIDDASVMYDQSKFSQAGLLVSITRINDVRRLNQFMFFCSNSVTKGGYFVLRYVPLENAAKKLKSRYPGLIYWPLYILHFIWYRALPKIPWLDTFYFSSKISWLDKFYLSITKKRNRILSKAEVWGRLAFCGMQVIAESKGDNELYIIAQRVELPVQNKRPSYYPVVALEKVGLDGKIINMHKIRTMFPFSEFLQKRIFEDHGLLPTGKFANDFRLTGLGKFLRKYWLDELPQVFDWLQGDVKLVGMRATSRHFLSLYPKEFYDLYVQIKPGLIPPIFDESTNGFDQIVKVELKYLKSYWQHPVRTDIRYFIKTFTDIVFRGIRSK